MPFTAVTVTRRPRIHVRCNAGEVHRDSSPERKRERRGVTPMASDVAEVHDSGTGFAPMGYEYLGFWDGCGVLFSSGLK
jgi:hypothetical protein